MQGTQTRERDADTGLVHGRQALLPMAGNPRRQLWPQERQTGGLAAAFSLAASSRRTFVMLPFAMIVGMIVYANVPFEPAPLALGAVAAPILLLVGILWRSAYLPLAIIVAAFWAGICLLPLHGAAFGTSMLGSPAYGTFEARVDEIISTSPEGQRIIVSGLVPVPGERPVDVEKVRLVVPAEPVLLLGDTIAGTMRLVSVPGPILPGAHDGQFHSYFSGVGAYGTVTSGFARVASSNNFDVSRSIEGTRTSIRLRIDSVLEGPSAAIGRAMVMGDQSGITDETRETMAASGLAHIYSISGLHLSIVAGGVFWLIRLGLAAIPNARIALPVKKLAACGGLVAAGGYMLLAGGIANVPALRSAIMLGLIFGAILAGRRALTMRNVAIAALLIIVIDPSSVFRPSFQLSFAAVVALIGTYEVPRKNAQYSKEWPARLGATIWTTGLTSVIAGVATLLFSAYHFQQTAPLGVVGNLLVLPVVSLVIMPSAVLAVLTMPFSLEAPCLAIMGWGIDRMIDAAVLVAGWSEGLTGNPLLTNVALLIGLASLAWFAYLPNWWRMLGPAIAVPLVLIFGLDQRPDILIADSTQAVAIRSGDSMGLLTGKTGSFAVDVWSQHYQQTIDATLIGSRCDSLGCIAQTDQYSVAVVKNAAAIAEDCGRHDLLIARMRVSNACQNTQVIDSEDLSAGGVHWLVWNEAAQRFDVRTAIPNVTRPWRVVPR